MNKIHNIFCDKIIGILSGFDRLVIKGILKNISYTKGMLSFLLKYNILLKDFNDYTKTKTEELKNKSYEYVKELDRPIHYLTSPNIRKNEYAQKIAREDRIENGLICLLTTLEPCISYDIFKNRETKQIELCQRDRKCLHLYYYWMDPVFGFMSCRLQTWFPFTCYFYINGREWLSRMLDKKGIGYKKSENCFLSINDFDKAQDLMKGQIEIDWPKILKKQIMKCNPLYRSYLMERNQEYYWMIYQSEWATDILFKSRNELSGIYNQMTLDAITIHSCENVMRFLGKKMNGNLKGEITSDYKNRQEGIRIKHSAYGNSIKMYDKNGIILRVETTINNPYFFKIFRPKEGEKDNSGIYPLRKGVVDIYRRTQISQSCNDRYIEALSTCESKRKVNDLISPICKPLYVENRRARSLRPWDENEIKLYEIINRGEFILGGFRNKNIRWEYFNKPKSKEEEKRMSSKITRYLWLLRAHGLIKKLPHSHRYQLTCKGREIIDAILKYKNISLNDLKKIA